MDLQLDCNQRQEIELFIKIKGFSFSINDVIEEYEKYKNGYYVSNSFKQVFLEFQNIFIKEL